MATVAQISVDIAANLDSLKKGLAEAEKRIEALDKSISKSTSSSEKSFESLGTTIKGIFALDVLANFGAALIGIGKDIITTSAEFEKLGAVLSNTFGSKTQGAIAQLGLQQLAQELPSSLLEITGAFLKLQNAGINPTTADMRAFSDVAANAGKGIDQFAEAINDASRGEFERLKEFFIDASKQGDKIIFTFKGQKVAIDNNSEAIKQYLVGLGQIPGVLGAAGVQMDTVSGKISNMGDAFDNFANVIGKSNRGIIASSLDFITEKVNALANALLSVEDRGLAEAAEGIKKQFTSLQEDFNSTAKNAKAGGQDVKAALDELANVNLTRFLEQFGKAKEALDAFEAENGGALNQVGRNLNNFTEEGVAAQQKYEAELAKLSGNVELYKAILNELPNIQDKATQSLEPLTAATLDLRNSMERTNDEIEKYYKVLNNPDASNAAVADATKQIKALETLREKYQEVIDTRQLGFNVAVPDKLQGQTQLQGIADTSGIKAIGTAAIDAQQPLKLVGDYLNEINDALGPDKLSPDQISKLTTATISMGDAFQFAGQSIPEKAAGIAQSVSEAFGEMAVAVGEAIGSLAAGFEGAGGILDNVLITLANLAIKVGTIAVGVAIGIEGIKKALESLNPYAAFVAGIALIALGAAAKSALSSSTSNVPHLATGTNYMPGDGLAYLHKGEAVVPKQYNPYLGGDMGGSWPDEIVLRASGDSLVAVLSRTNQSNDRRGRG